jgi:hypothetical protein
MNSYSGVWRAGSGPYYLWANVTWDSFRAKWEELSAQNMRLADLEVHVTDGQLRYTGAWRAGTGGHYLWVNADWNGFRDKWQELGGQGLRLSACKAKLVGGQMRYFGVWAPGNDGYYLWANVTWDSFRAKWEEVSAQGLRLVDLSTEVVNGEVRYTGAWRAGTGGHYLWVNADWSGFVDKWRELAPQGLRLTVIDSHSVNGQRRYAGVWRPGTDGYYLWGNARWNNFVAKWRELGDRGFRLIHVDVLDAASVPTRPWVRLHFKTLTAPTVPAATMLARMREVYNASGIEVELGSTETLNLAALNDLDVGACTMGNTTAEQNQLFGNRNNVGANDVAVYFVRSTVPPFNGCAAHPAGRPSCVVVQGATQWTLGHEVGHVLGLSHVNDNNRLMTGNGTANITNPPPDLVASEVTTMGNSSLTQDW